MKRAVSLALWLAASPAFAGTFADDCSKLFADKTKGSTCQYAASDPSKCLFHSDINALQNALLDLCLRLRAADEALCALGGAPCTMPSITGMTPTTGPWGTSVTLTGTNFVGATVTYNGGPVSYVVVSATSITATIPSGAVTGTFTVTGASSVTSPTFTVEVSSAPSTMSAANRTSGVAPLAVFFDAADTTNEGTAWPWAWTSGVVQPADKEGTLYAWDFGDLSAGTWGTVGSWSGTGRPKNTATGYTAAHVYETPGTYTATLTVTQTNGTVTTYTQEITVSAFAGATYYAAATSVGAADGSSEANAGTLASGWTWVNGASNRRLLLKRGDSFTAGELNTTASRAGNIVGAYGSGARPAITCSGIDANSNDWRFVDLELIGPGSGYGVALAVTYKISNVTFLRMKVSGYRPGFGSEAISSIYSDPPDGIAFVECESDMSGVPDNIAAYFRILRRASFLGCNFHDSVSHALRPESLHKGVVSDCRLYSHRSLGYQHALKLHSRIDGTGPETRWVTVSDNVCDFNGNWVISVGPQNAQEDERVSHVVIERNKIDSYGTNGENDAGIEVSARNVLVRNNVMDGSSGDPTFAGVLIEQRGIEPAPDDVRVYNNSIVRKDAVGTFYGVDVVAGTNVVVRNNIAWAPDGSTRAMVNGTATASDNLAVTSDPLFTNLAGDVFTLQAGSPAANAGATLPEVREDYARTSRPVSSGYDAGAYESR